MFNIYFTNPIEHMLLGFQLEQVRVINEETDELQEGDMFSIGIFIGRLDILFNLRTITEDEI